MKKKMRYLAMLLMSTSMVLSGCGGGTANSSTSQPASAEASESPAATSEISTALDAATADAAAEASSVKEPEEPAKTVEDLVEEGRSFFYGLDGKEVDEQAAMHCLEQALEQAEAPDAEPADARLLAQAWYYIARIHAAASQDAKSTGEQEEADALDAAAIEAYENALAADNTFALARFGLGMYYRGGYGVEQDINQAKEYFQAAIDAGFAEGNYGFAVERLNAQDYAAAFDYAMKATEGTEPEWLAAAYGVIGDEYYERWNYGNGGEDNRQEAIRNYEKAHELNGKRDGYYAYSAFELIYVFNNMDQEGTAPIAAKWAAESASAYRYYADAFTWADIFYRMGQNGEIYFNEDGIASGELSKPVIEKEDAERWNENRKSLLEAHANKGDAEMCNLLGEYYLFDEGDSAAAVEWFEQASDGGSAKASFRLGELYCFGRGKHIQVDYEKAFAYYRLAKEQGYETTIHYADNELEEGQKAFDKGYDVDIWLQEYVDSGQLDAEVVEQYTANW